MKFSTVLAAALAAVASMAPVQAMTTAASAASASTTEVSRAREAFNLWAVEFDISFSSPVERERRFAVFKENFEEVLENNSRGYTGDSIQMGLNQFSHMTKEEFQSTLTYKARNNIENINMTPVTPRDRKSYQEVECDLGVRDQGNCGSCWAFSTIAAVESINCRVNGEKIDLSEQELVDCDYNQLGCNGAYYLDEPLNFVAESNGLSSIKDYPYTARDGTCKASQYTHRANVIEKASFIKTVDDLIEEIDKFGAVSVALDATSFMSYRSGVLTPANCTNRALNHAVTATGYAIQDDGSVHITIKNSWGTRWGEDGYVTVQYGACGLGAEMVGIQTRSAARNFLHVE